MNREFCRCPPSIQRTLRGFCSLNQPSHPPALPLPPRRAEEGDSEVNHGSRARVETHFTMSSRKRMSIGNFNLAKSSPTETVKSIATKRRSSISSWAVGISGALNRSLQSAAATADRFERRLFAEYDEQMDEDGSDAYGMLCAQRGQGQRAEFESR